MKSSPPDRLSAHLPIRGMTKMPVLAPKKIAKICRDFSEAILEFSAGDSANMCFMVTSPLCGYLEFLGVKCRMTEGYVGKSRLHHWWIETDDGLCIDPTADQFKEIPVPRYYCGPRPAHYQPKPRRGLAQLP